MFTQTLESATRLSLAPAVDQVEASTPRSEGHTQHRPQDTRCGSVANEHCVELIWAFLLLYDPSETQALDLSENLIPVRLTFPYVRVLGLDVDRDDPRSDAGEASNDAVRGALDIDPCGDAPRRVREGSVESDGLDFDLHSLETSGMFAGPP